MLRKILNKERDLIKDILDKKRNMTDQMVVEIAELWNQVNHQANGMQVLENRLAESIRMNEALFSDFDEDWEFDKELEFRLEYEDPLYGEDGQRIGEQEEDEEDE